MLINILQKRLDEEKLTSEMQEFEIANNLNAYVFMNKETFEELMSTCPSSIYSQVDKYSDGVITHYCGRRIYDNENLKFGEVEIR